MRTHCAGGLHRFALVMSDTRAATPPRSMLQFGPGVRQWPSSKSSMAFAQASPDSPCRKGCRSLSPPPQPTPQPQPPHCHALPHSQLGYFQHSCRSNHYLPTPFGMVRRAPASEGPSTEMPATDEAVPQLSLPAAREATAYITPSSSNCVGDQPSPLV
jgi:hypothetical protein